MKKIIAILLFTVPMVLSAQSNGGYAGSFLRMGLGARGQSLGNAGIADQTSGYSFYYNPALTAFTEKKIISLSSSSMSLDRHTNYIGFSMKAPPDAGFSLGWINSGVGELYQYNSVGETQGKMDHSINAAYFNVARPIGSKLAIGLSIKYLWESIDFGSEKYLSSGLGWEFGTIYRINEDLNVAFVLRDVSSKLKASTSKIFEHGGTTIDEFPITYVLGIRYITPYKWLRVLYDFETSDNEAHKNHIGLEAVYREAVAIRGGYDHDRVTFGAGINFMALKTTKESLLGYLGMLNYAFLPSRYDEGSSHIFSWQIYLD